MKIENKEVGQIGLDPCIIIFTIRQNTSVNLKHS